MTNKAARTPPPTRIPENTLPIHKESKTESCVKRKERKTERLKFQERSLNTPERLCIGNELKTKRPFQVSRRVETYAFNNPTHLPLSRSPLTNSSFTPISVGAGKPTSPKCLSKLLVSFCSCSTSLPSVRGALQKVVIRRRRTPLKARNERGELLQAAPQHVDPGVEEGENPPGHHRSRVVPTRPQHPPGPPTAHAATRQPATWCCVFFY